MNTRLLPALLIAAAALAPASAFAAGAMTDARAVSRDPINFDGGRPRPELDPVRASSTLDRRTAEEIAKDEQAKADARARAAIEGKVPGVEKEIEPPKPAEWRKSAHILSGVKGAIVGLLIGSLWGLTGLGIGALIGGLVGYGLSRLTV